MDIVPPMQPPAPDQPPPQSAWRFARASRAHVVIDAAAYFMLMQQAMEQARQRIHLIGWDFDTRMRLGPGRRFWNLPRKTVNPARLGAFVIWLCERTPGLQVRLLHGQCDESVPWSIATRAAAALRSADVQVTLVKDGDHRLSRPQDIALLVETVARLGRP